MLRAWKFSDATPVPLSETSIRSIPDSFSFISIIVLSASIEFSISSFTAILKLKTT